MITILYYYDTGSDSLRGAAGLDPAPDLDNANVGMSEKIAKRFAIKSAGSIHKDTACLLLCTEIDPDYIIFFYFYNRGSKGN